MKIFTLLILSILVLNVYTLSSRNLNSSKADPKPGDKMLGRGPPLLFPPPSDPLADNLGVRDTHSNPLLHVQKARLPLQAKKQASFRLRLQRVPSKALLLGIRDLIPQDADNLLSCFPINSFNTNPSSHSFIPTDLFPLSPNPM